MAEFETKELSKEILKEMRDHKKNRDIVNVMVRVASVNKETGNSELIADYNGVKIVIPKGELDATIDYKSIVHFVGAEVGVVVLSFDAKKGEAICSRAEAQKIVTPDIIARLEDSESFVGTIVNILPYGAYVDIGGVTGLLKNYDFAVDTTLIKEVKRIGDKVSVHLKQYSKNGAIVFEADKKYRSPDAIDPESIEVGQIVLGVVRSRKPFGYFVNIAPGIDVLTSSDIDDEINEEQKVQIKVLKVYRDDDNNIRVRGVIKRVL
jgi:ribosomal protein S1